MKTENVIIVRVKTCTSKSYNYSSYIGRKVSVIKDPINNLWYNFYPDLNINKKCDADGDHSRKGYLYGLLRGDCEILKQKAVPFKSNDIPPNEERVIINSSKLYTALLDLIEGKKDSLIRAKKLIERMKKA